MKSISAREIAFQVLTRYPGRSKPDDLLEKILSDCDAERRERALATQIVSGTIKWRNKIDYVVKLLSRKKRVVSPEVLNILRLSLYQLMFLDRVPAYGATNEAVKLAKEHGDRYQAAYVNAILRTYLRTEDTIEFPDLGKDPVKHISVVYSHPQWLVRRWLARYGVAEVIELCKANNRVAPIGLRPNLLATSTEEVEQMLVAEGGEIMPRAFEGVEHIYVRGLSPIETTRPHREGLVQVQDASSTLVGLVVSPVPGSRVVDLCSAPGGKVTHLYELARGRGTVVASDVSLPRLETVRANGLRLGHSGLMYSVCDGRRPAFRGADFVLVDAPCTGLGVLARRWDLRWTKRERDIERMAAYQTELLTAAIGIAKKGGVVVYSTCSIEPDENEMVVGRVLETVRGAGLQDAGRFVPSSVVYKEGMIQTLPHRTGTDGIFAARLERR